MTRAKGAEPSHKPGTKRTVGAMGETYLLASRGEMTDVKRKFCPIAESGYWRGIISQRGAEC